MAKIYLDSTDTAFIIVDGSHYVYGANGNQTITIGSNAKNVVMDQNIEKVVFSGAANDYTYAQMGNQIGVYKDGTLIATVPLQGDSNGTEFQFSNGTTNAKLTGGVMTIGGGTLTSTPAAVVMTDPAITTTPTDTTAPTLSTSSPSDDATSVAVGGNIVLTFGESVSAVSGKNILIKKTSDSSTVATIAADDTTQVSIFGGVVTVNPTSDLTAGTSYYVLIDSGAFKDASSNVCTGMSLDTTLNFTTAAPTDTTAPTISSVAITGATGAAADTLSVGDVVTVTVVFNEVVNVTGTPNLALTIGNSTIPAVYASGTGTNSLAFTFTIFSGQTDANGISIAADALTLNTGTIKDAAGNDAILTHSAATDNASYKVDTTAPTATLPTVTDNSGTVTGSLTSGGATDDTSLDLAGTCESGSTVKVYNGSTLLGNATVSGTSWTYAATVANATTYTFNVKETDMAGNESAATSDFTVVGDMSAPADAASSPITNTDTGNNSTGVYAAGDVITIKFTEPVNTATLTIDDITLNNSHTFGANPNPTLAAVSPSDGYATSFAITLGTAPTVAANDIISVANTKAVDAIGNANSSPVTFTVPAMALADTVAPAVSSVAISSATGAFSNTLNATDVVTVTVGFSEAVNVTGTPNLGLNIGGSTVQAAYASGTGTNSLTFNYTILANQTDADGISIAVNALDLNSGTIKDAAGNIATLTHSAVTANASYMVDTNAPTANLTTVTDNVGALTGALTSGATTDDTTLDMAGTCESGSAVKVYNGSTLLGSATVSGTGWTYTASVLSGATYQLNVKETDIAGNESAATSNFAVTVAAATLDSAATAKSATDADIDTASFLATSDNIIQSLNSSLIDSSWKWTNPSMTYSFNSSMPSEYTGDMANGWQAVSAGVQTVVDSVIAAADTIVASSFSKLTSGDGILRYNMVTTSAGVNGFAAYPSTSPVGGDVFLSSNIGTNTDSSNNINTGKYGAMTIIHELGHALGLKHPFNAPALTTGDNHVNTVMSYTNYKPINLTFTDPDPVSGSISAPAMEGISPKTFMVYDIAALQNMYGADTTTATGDTTYTYDTTPFYASIWDAGGTDTLNFSATTSSNIVKLTSGSYSNVNYRDVATQISTEQTRYQTALSPNNVDSWVANDVFGNLISQGYDIYTGEKALGIAYGAVIENAIGGSAGDSFYDNAVNNVLTGNAGDDIFYLGTGGYDTVDGGAGSADKIVLTVNKADTQMESKGSGVTLLVGSTFAISLTGVETIQFLDQSYTVA